MGFPMRSAIWRFIGTTYRHDFCCAEKGRYCILFQAIIEMRSDGLLMSGSFIVKSLYEEGYFVL